MVGNLERPRRAGQEQDGEHALAVEPALHGADGKRERRRAPCPPGRRWRPRGGRTGRATCPATIERHEQRKELHEPDEAEVERIVGERVDLPAHRHPLHHEGAVGERPRAPEAHERAVARQGRGVGGGRAWLLRFRLKVGHAGRVDGAKPFPCARHTEAGIAKHYSGMASSVSISRLSRITTFSAKRAAPSSSTT